ncbi:Lysophospholipid acyltransferase 7 [Zootermopsis nevadensis]|uniref:Lysophospholipid acyltransferase 7 n=1 Tax=Zootermopsis nevadensis TaxID=136037 RepID=A0A067QLR8_ZOONE|nr:Lysophospholipid acyltransferase 7 [Zootermopsis nevadensis]
MVKANMEWDDIVYLVLLLFSIGIGYVFRQIEDKETRKWLSSGLGFLLVLIVSGKHIMHPIICTAINAFIILATDRRKCHIVSFFFTFAYLFFFRTTQYFGIPYPPAHTNMIQMIVTLKVAGLAFEVHNTAAAAKEKEHDDSAAFAKLEAAEVHPSFQDVFHYTFCYIGIMTGPYYTYRTYRDWLEYPFLLSAPCKDATIQKMKYVPLYAVLFVIASTIFPLKYAESEEFYNERSVFYRIWYINPTFFIFRMRLYTGMVLSECVCTMAGLGAYPEFTAPSAGHGPTKEFGKLKEIASNNLLAKEEKYNFETIHNVDPYGSEFVPTFRNGMKCWNMCIQYWLAVNVYKRLARNQFRPLITMTISAIWHGVYIGYYLCLMSAPMYLPVEDVYIKIRKDATGLEAKFWDFFLWFFKMQAFSYMAIVFLLLHIELTFKYWSSVYFAGHIVAIILFVSGKFILKFRRRKSRSVSKSE